MILNITDDDNDWNKLMPVWIKFRDLEFTKDSQLYRDHQDWIVALQCYLFSSDDPKRFADRLYYAIKWYNKQEVHEI